MNANDGKRLISSAVLLTAAALVTKALSIGYRIPYQNITGDIGFYIYQQVYPIHGIVFTLAMYGFPVVISKLLAERANQHTGQLLSISFWVLTVVSLLSFIALFAFSPFIASFVGDEQLKAAYRAISFSVLFIPFISVLRGLFQAEEKVIPTAVSQISEQVVRVIVIVTLAFYFMNGGYGVYAAGAGAAFGSIIGGLASFLTLLFFYYRSQDKKSRQHKMKLERHEVWKITRQLLTQGFAISIGALSLIFFQLVDAMTVLNQLKVYGLTAIDAKVMKGVFDRGQPLLQLGFTLATSLSLVIVPAIVMAIAANTKQEAINKAGFALKITFVVSAAASIGLAVIIEPTNVMLFKDSRGSELLALLGCTIFFGSLTLASIAILQGAGRVNVTLLIVAIGLLVKIVMNVTLIPFFGIYAAALATVIGLAIMAVCTLIFVHRYIQLFSNYHFHFRRIVLAVSGMAFIAYLWKTIAQSFLFTDGRLGATGVALSTVFLAVSAYCSLLLLFRVFSKSELAYFSKSN